MMDKVKGLLLLFALSSYLASFAFAYLNTFGVKSLFYSSNGDIDNKYFLQASPEPIAFGIIWPIIYSWNLVGILYIIIACCGKSQVLVPNTFLLCYGLSFLSTVGWLFAYCRELLRLSFLLLVLAILFVYSAIGISYKTVNDHITSTQSEHKAGIWCMRILVQNGLCTFAAWLTIATLLNFAYLLIYDDSFGDSAAILRGSFSVESGSTVVLIMLMAIMMGWFILENLIFEKYCRYTYTIYPVLIHGLFWLTYKLYNLPDAKQNLICASINLGVALMALVARVTMAVGYRQNQSVQKSDSLQKKSN